MNEERESQWSAKPVHFEHLVKKPIWAKAKQEGDTWTAFMLLDATERRERLLSMIRDTEEAADDGEQ